MTESTDAPASTPQETIKRVAALYGLKYLDLIGPSRRQWLVRARKAAAVALDADGVPAAEIARFLSRDHTTVLYYLGRV
jgi:chromosomal replication initiation ATPase DnaA